jgi:hypothetical protein
MAVEWAAVLWDSNRSRTGTFRRRMFWRWRGVHIMPQESRVLRYHERRRRDFVECYWYLYAFIQRVWIHRLLISEIWVDYFYSLLIATFEEHSPPYPLPGYHSAVQIASIHVFSLAKAKTQSMKHHPLIFTHCGNTKSRTA